MSNREDIDRAIDAALEFLIGNQLSTGQFKTYGSFDDTLWTGYRVVDEVFTSSLVLYTLCFVDDERVKTMMKRGVLFFTDQRGAASVWRYWTKLSNGDGRVKRDLVPIWNPPDVEDTALVSFILERNGVACRENRGVILGNRRADGLFYTWIVPRSHIPRDLGYWRVVLPQYFRKRQLEIYWKFSGARKEDIDGGINSNVLFYLGECPETQPVIDYLLDVIRRGEEASCCKWYRRPLTIHYFVSRAYAHGVGQLSAVRDEIVRRVEEAIHGEDGFSCPLEAAMGVSTWLNYGSRPALMDGAVDYLVSTQKSDGSWPRHALYGRVGGWSFGAEEITTGLCVEALSRYRTLLEGNAPR
jgi:hypothetical protein